MRYTIIVFISLGMLLGSCEKEPVDPPISDNEYINAWILEEMDFWYLYQTAINPDIDQTLDPTLYFSSQLDLGDRFSFISESAQELQNNLQGISLDPGFEFIPYRVSQTSDQVILQIAYVKPSSPAAEAGIRRGDIIVEINGQEINITNFPSLAGALNQTAELGFGSPASLTVTSTKTITPVVYNENPIHLDTVYSLEGRNVGYLVLNRFINGIEDNPQLYRNELLSVFADFKAKGVTDLVLDLRYNPGGSISNAITLGSLIASNVTGSDIFTRTQFNDEVQELILNDPSLGEDFVTDYFEDLPESLNGQVSELYVLTSSRTASASELLINGLKPYMPVFLIGDTTNGKNVGSITLSEPDDERITYGMQPIVLFYFNRDGTADFGNGFAPDIVNLDNNLNKLPLGDINESLLSIALNDISGISVRQKSLDIYPKPLEIGVIPPALFEMKNTELKQIQDR